jgi:hypothetical protein
MEREMRTLTCGLAFTLLLSSVTSADGLPTVMLDAPEGWNRERIELPPRFAPDMGVSGYEEIRFAPGMFRAGTESFFSYLIVFVLDGEPLDDEALERELLRYYRGLAKAVGSGRGLMIDASAFTLELVEVEEDDSDDAAPAKKPGEWIGTLNWTEPFVTGAAQELRIEISVGRIEESEASHVTMCISPQAADEKIWEALHGVRDGVRFSIGE